MSDPADPDYARRYGELVQRIGAALLEVAPPGWRRLDLVATMSAAAQDYGLTVLMADGTAGEVAPPEDTVAALVDLRGLMYTPERGAWFSARYMMNPPTEYHVFYNYDHDPLWDPPVPAEVFARDLRQFPRPPEQVPGWLRRRLDEARQAQEEPSR